MSMLFLSSCTKFPNNLGDFALGESISSVEAKLTSIGIEKSFAQIPLTPSPICYYISESTYIVEEQEDEIKVIYAHFSTSNPYKYKGYDWLGVEIGFFNNKVHWIGLQSIYLPDGNAEWMSIANDQLRSRSSSIDKGLYASYAKYQTENEVTQDAIYSLYTDGKKSMMISYYTCETIVYSYLYLMNYYLNIKHI